MRGGGIWLSVCLAAVGDNLDFFIFRWSASANDEFSGTKRNGPIKRSSLSSIIDENMYFPILFVHLSTVRIGLLGYARAGVKIRNLSL